MVVGGGIEWRWRLVATVGDNSGEWVAVAATAVAVGASCPVLLVFHTHDHSWFCFDFLRLVTNFSCAYKKMNLSGLTGSPTRNQNSTILLLTLNAVIFPRININDPYKRLGISKEASEDEIQSARTFLVQKYAGHKPSVNYIRSAQEVGTFIVSWLLGTFLMVSVIPPVLKGPRSLEVTTSLVTYTLLWVSSTYLK
ncbi:uncharacterized protein LOC110901807 [Helianthus annuus]|uniref:uncharacterized protein LOC110901807 n=1 Tax=Helianthus annuus TaxID=4232 RepID=UPI001652E3E9|nr:uncharacterized protein LOC110901807 [Helianthus annuus]